LNNDESGNGIALHVNGIDESVTVLTSAIQNSSTATKITDNIITLNSSISVDYDADEDYAPGRSVVNEIALYSTFGTAYTTDPTFHRPFEVGPSFKGGNLGVKHIMAKTATDASKPEYINTPETYFASFAESVDANQYETIANSFFDVTDS